MKKFLMLLLILALLATTVVAADGNVTYSGDAGELIFQPGTDHSLTDLFPNFKDVMPGDRLEQKITVKNDASKEVKVKIYIRSLGAHEDSVEFLSQMHLRVDVLEGEMDYMFDAAASDTAQLTDWVCLGTLYSGGVVDLNVILDVPVTMGNEFQNQVGYLDWEFMVEEFPVEDTDPRPPSQTGDNTKIFTVAGVAAASLAVLIILLLLRKKEQGGTAHE